MSRIFTCLVTEHDWRLVLLAVAVCLLTSIAAIHLFHRACATAGRTRLLWLLTAGAATGYGIWATHFIAMLAFTAGLPHSYELLLTVFSLFAATVTTGAGFSVALGTTSRWGIPVGGAVLGSGIALMHYLGMSAFEVQGHIEWSGGLIAASVIMSILFGMAALDVAARHRSSTQSTLIAATLLTLAIVTLHFTGMGAAEIVPDPTVATTATSLSPNALAVALASAAAAVLGVSLVAALSGVSREQLIESSAAEVAQQAGRLETALENMSQGLCMFDAEQRIVVANRRYAEMYGLTYDQVKPGTTLREVLEARITRGIYEDADVQAAIAAKFGNFKRDGQFITQLSDGRYISTLRKPMTNGGLVTTHEDVTDRHQAEARIEHMAHHDGLTDLPNRALFRKRLEESLAAMHDGGRPLGVLVLDLDRFKEVNDSQGHPIGDALLQAVAARLRSCVRETDTIGRIGGDEFAIVQRAPEPAAHSAELARRLLEELSAPFDIRDTRVSIGASIGITVAPTDGDTVDALLTRADLALYRAKADGRGTFHYFEPEMDERMQARRSLERDLRCALGKGEFVLHYQPLVNLERDEICGFEALLRWRHPVRGNVRPDQFISLAEETGQIVPIGEWVLRQACTDAVKWPAHTKIAVNVSAAQFKSPNFVEVVVRTLAATGLAPSRLELEITESVMLQESDGTFAMLTRLHDLGVRIALDDFGTGYSSLSNLRRFPFDKIKIDRSFVSDLSVANVDALAVVRSVAQLGVSLGMCTTAEGVETKEQLEYVRAEGCTEIQGYYFCPPSSAEDIERLLQREMGKAASAA